MIIIIIIYSLRPAHESGTLRQLHCMWDVDDYELLRDYLWRICLIEASACSDFLLWGALCNLTLLLSLLFLLTIIFTAWVGKRWLCRAAGDSSCRIEARTFSVRVPACFEQTDFRQSLNCTAVGGRRRIIIQSNFGFSTFKGLICTRGQIPFNHRECWPSFQQSCRAACDHC